MSPGAAMLLPGTPNSAANNTGSADNRFIFSRLSTLRVTLRHTSPNLTKFYEGSAVGDTTQVTNCLIHVPAGEWRKYDPANLFRLNANIKPSV